METVYCCVFNRAVVGSLSNSNSVRVFKIGKKEDGSGNVGVLGTMDFPKVGDSKS